MNRFGQTRSQNRATRAFPISQWDEGKPVLEYEDAQTAKISASQTLPDVKNSYKFDKDAEKIDANGNIFHPSDNNSVSRQHVKRHLQIYASRSSLNSQRLG